LVTLFANGPGGSVQNSPDLTRILALPRRKYDLAQWEKWATELTWRLAKAPGVALRPVQGAVLHELEEYGGCLASVRVGGGKTLCTLTAGFLLGAIRPVLVIPAALREKTRVDAERYSRDWHIRIPRIFSYEELGREGAVDALMNYAPDLLMLDELHKAKNPKAGVTRRLARYMAKRPDTKVMGLSGTAIKGSVEDIAQPLFWTHKDHSPMPIAVGEIKAWSRALDAKGPTPVGVGALEKLCSSEDLADTKLETVRNGFRRRLVETPGVIVSQDQGFGGSLIVTPFEYTPKPETDLLFKRLRELWETPDGWALEMSSEVWAKARELAIGMHYVWEPRPPIEWLSARKEWAAGVREILEDSRTLDTPGAVQSAVLRGDIPHLRGILDTWSRLRPTFEINSKPVWHDESALEACAKWALKKPGIVWCSHGFFAKRLAKMTGLPVYGAGGVDSSGNPVENADPKRSAILSMAANSEGRNLQTIWSRNLVTAPTSNAAQWEQMLGRTHRDGQPADCVEVEVMLACSEHWASFLRALDGAKMVQSNTGQSQKLLLADIDWPSNVRDRRGFRWMTNRDIGKLEE